MEGSCRVSDVKLRLACPAPALSSHYTIRAAAAAAAARAAGRAGGGLAWGARAARPDSFLWGAGHGGAGRPQAERGRPGRRRGQRFHFSGTAGGGGETGPRQVGGGGGELAAPRLRPEGPEGGFRGKWEGGRPQPRKCGKRAGGHGLGGRRERVAAGRGA